MTIFTYCKGACLQGAMLIFLLTVVAGCQPGKNSPTLSAPPIWQGIALGNTENEVTRILGEPKSIQELRTYTIYNYLSAAGGMATPDSVAFRNGQVQLIMDRTYMPHLESSLALYGQPELVTWSWSILSRTRLFVFPRLGRAVVAQNQYPPQKAGVVETWYFEPMTLEEFKSTIMPAFVPSTPPIRVIRIQKIIGCISYL